MISGEMTVARLLDGHPELIEVLAEFHPHFKQLRNRLLRRVMAPRVTVSQAARMAGVPAEELLGVLRRAVGEAPHLQAPHLQAPHLQAPHPALSPEGRGRFEIPSPFQGEGWGEGGRPRAVADVSDAQRVHLDVRHDIGEGREPFARIMAAVKALGDDQVLVLRVPFEPIPLYDVLGRRGLAHWTERRAQDDWSAWFYRDAAPRDPPTAAPVTGAGPRMVLDVRGLEPPQPMVRVLEEIDRLGPGAELEVRHDRRPIFLYPQLDELGFMHETDEPEPGLVRIRIRRGAA
ncbi:MAG: DUF2249 domain-containing protein [Candidatus Rokuibacteriota bacterium]